MKKTFILLVLPLFMIGACKTETTINSVVIDSKTKSEILFGECNKAGFQKIPFDGWFNPEYAAYVADSATIAQIAEMLTDDLNIKMVLGTWCGDSRREVPRFYKILDAVGFSEANIVVSAVNTAKQNEHINATALDLQRVPTIIFYKGTTEIGRIIETPTETLERDMLNIFMIVDL